MRAWCLREFSQTLSVTSCVSLKKLKSRERRGLALHWDLDADISEERVAMRIGQGGQEVPDKSSLLASLAS